jgi:hypothetical protein
MRGQLSRLAPLSGLVMGGLILAAFVVGGSSPNSDSSGRHVVSWYVNHNRGQNALAYCLAYAALCALFFAASLRSHLRARTSSEGPALALGLAGAVVLSVGVAIGSGATFSLIDAPRAISPAAEQALSVISNDVPFVVLLVGVVAFMVGHGIAIVRTGVLPRWLGWAAIVVGIVAAIPVVGWLALFGLILWSIVAGVVLFIREGRPAAAPTAATPAA